MKVVKKVQDNQEDINFGGVSDRLPTRNSRMKISSEDVIIKEKMRPTRKAVSHNRSLKKTPLITLIDALNVAVFIFIVTQNVCSITTDELTVNQQRQPEQLNFTSSLIIATLEPQDQISIEKNRSNGRLEQGEKVRGETTFDTGSTLSISGSNTPSMRNIFDSLKDVEQATTIISNRENPNLQNFVELPFGAQNLIKTLEMNDQIVSESALRDPANKRSDSDNTPRYSIEQVIPASVIGSKVVRSFGEHNDKRLPEVLTSGDRRKLLPHHNDIEPQQQRPKKTVKRQHNMDIRLVQRASRRPPVYMSAPKQISELESGAKEPPQSDLITRKSDDLKAAAGHGYKSSSQRKMKKYKRRKKVVKVKKKSKDHHAQSHHSGAGGDGGHHDMGKYYE